MGRSTSRPGSRRATALPVVIGIPGMVLGELDIGPTTGRVITAIGNGEMTHYVAASVTSSMPPKPGADC